VGDDGEQDSGDGEAARLRVIERSIAGGRVKRQKLDEHFK
jgi:hypothetical protein